jgi:hypothetical protein
MREGPCRCSIRLRRGGPSRWRGSRRCAPAAGRGVGKLYTSP